MPDLPDSEIEFTYAIKEQKDNRFTGTMRGGSFEETIIGALRPPEYNTGIFLDEDGKSTFSLRDPTTIGLCYSHLYPTSKGVACFTITKNE